MGFHVSLGECRNLDYGSYMYVGCTGLELFAFLNAEA